MFREVKEIAKSHTVSDSRSIETKAPYNKPLVLAPWLPWHHGFFCKCVSLAPVCICLSPLDQLPPHPELQH